MNTTSVIEKVQKLLSLSKSNNANEAAAAAAAANKLIDQYRLSTADLEVEGQTDDPLELDGGYVYESGKVTTWKLILLNQLTSHYGLYVYNDNTYATGRKVSRFRLVGRKSDIAVVRYMFAWLVMECQRLADAEAKGMGRIFVASYCEGFVKGVSEQLNLSREAVKKEATISSIIKIDSRKMEATNYAHQLVKGLHTQKGSSARRVNYSAYNAGKTRGENIHLGASLGTGKAPKLFS
jgi:type II secretory pathway pseudopilin PulG